MTTASATVSEAEFLTLPESNRPVELLDGEVIVAPSPSFWHQELLARVVAALRTHCDRHLPHATVAQAPLDVRFGPDRILQPDAMVFLSGLDRSSPTPVETIPDICIEVLSTNRAYDKITKRYVYGEAGVSEYWIVDPVGTLERRYGPALIQATTIGEVLSSPLLPAFEFPIGPLFS